MNQRDQDFEDAIRWHKRGVQISPTARSVLHTRAILQELNQAIDLLTIVQPDGPNCCTEFLARHRGAPYL